MLLADRVAQTTTAIGNAVGFDLTAGAKTGHRTFVAAVGAGVVTYYAIVHQTSGEWEVGIGSVTAGAPDQLQRTTILASSNAGARVNFSAGTKDVFVNLPASKNIVADENGLTSLPGGLAVPGQVAATSGAFTGAIGIVAPGGAFQAVNVSGVGTTGAYVHMGTSGSDTYFGVDNSAGTLLIPGSAAYASIYRNDVAHVFGSGAGMWMTVTAGGTIIDQAANDGSILEFRSSDVAHGMTSITNTTAFGFLQKSSAITGGLMATGLTEDATPALYFRGFVGTADTTKSTGGNGGVVVEGATKSGTTAAAMGANANIFAVKDAGTTRFILDADGDSHQDVGTAWTNFDTHDDVAVLNHLAAHVTRRRDPLRKTFGKWLRKNRSELERMKLVTFNRDGHHFVNMSRLTMLHTGALRQIGARLDRVIEVLLSVGVPRSLLVPQLG